MNQWMLKLLTRSPLSRAFKSPRFGYGSFIGVFPSWSAALAAIPSGFSVGFDQAAATPVFTNYPLKLVRTSDYPSLFHLRNLVQPNMRVVDLGGSVGAAYYNGLAFFSWPEQFEWVICDLPAVIEAAREVALREGEKSRALRFISNIEDAPACDIFLSTGSLQLIEQPLPALLKKLPGLPAKLLINRIPVWDREAICTLSDIGFNISPYKIFNRQEWVESVEQLGYRLIDDWECPGSTMSIRFHKQLRLHSYHGFYFSRVS